MKFLCWLGLHKWEKGCRAWCFDWGDIQYDYFCSRCLKEKRHD